MICYTTIIGNYDDLKEPRVKTPGWRYVCYTDQDIASDIWEIVKVRPVGEPRMTAKYYKLLFHRFIEEETCLYVDASFYINCNLDRWMKRHRGTFTALKHHLRDCVYKESDACIDHGRGSAGVIIPQIERYRALGIPEHNGLAETGILMRTKTPEVIDFMERWYTEVSEWSGRDQIAFGLINWQTPIAHLTDYDYWKGKKFLYMPHLEDADRRARRMKYYRKRRLLC